MATKTPYHHYMTLTITIIVLMALGIVYYKLLSTPSNPFPSHVQYTAAWEMLTKAKQKRKFMKTFFVDKKTQEVVIRKTRRIYKLLAIPPNGVDIFNYRSLEPKVWSADYFTPEAAMREARRKKKYICRSKNEFFDLLSLLPQQNETDRLKCLIKLFGLFPYGAIDVSTGKRISEDGEVWVSFGNDVAICLFFKGDTLSLREINYKKENTSALPALVYELLFH